MTSIEYEIKPFTEHSIYLSFGDDISIHTLKIIRSLMTTIEEAKITGFAEAVPGYHNITIYYDPMTVYSVYRRKDIQKCFIYEIEQWLNKTSFTDFVEQSIIEIPVCYDLQFGTDLEFVAKSNQLTVDEVVQYHSEAKYTVHMLGFSPGFPFLSGMNEKIATPRKKVPARKIAAGSVGIAGKQTGIYPNETPGGWQIIGRTPTRLFTIHEKQPSLLNPGDLVKFYPIDLKAFKELEEKDV